MKPGIPVVLGPNTPPVPRTKLCHEVKGDFQNPEEENRAIVEVAMSCLGIISDPEGLAAIRANPEGLGSCSEYLPRAESLTLTPWKYPSLDRK